MLLTKYEHLRHGMRVTCKIEGKQVDDAKISIDPNGDVYVCQNVENGSSADDKLGYRYSWVIARKGQNAPWLCDECTDLRSVGDESRQEWQLVYVRGADKLERDKITLDGKTYSPDELKKVCNRMRAALAAHKRHFPREA